VGVVAGEAIHYKRIEAAGGGRISKGRKGKNERADENRFIHSQLTSSKPTETGKGVLIIEINLTQQSLIGEKP